jgi:hypothetical protein
MLMHSCRCILFIVVTGFYLFAKRFKNHLKMFLEKSFQKKKKKIFILFTPSLTSGLLARFPLARSVSLSSPRSSWASPRRRPQPTLPRPALPPCAVDTLGSLVDFIPSSASHAAETETAIPHPRSPRCGASRASDPI